jgi:hypothetical protein
MKLLSRLVFAGALCASSASAADFEGTVTMKMRQAKEAPQVVNFSLTKGRSRIDIATPDGNAAVLFTATAGEMIILLPEQKMYLVQSVPKPGDLPGAGDHPDQSVKQTNEKEKILGYDCVKYISTSPEGTTDIWVTDQLGAFMGLGGGNPMGGPGSGGPVPQAWEQALRGKEVFPLRVITKGPKGRETFRMEATAVKKQPLPASTFNPPEDFQKLDVGNMMRGMSMPGMRPPGR